MDPCIALRCAVQAHLERLTDFTVKAINCFIKTVQEVIKAIQSILSNSCLNCIISCSFNVLLNFSICFPLFAILHERLKIFGFQPDLECKHISKHWHFQWNCNFEFQPALESSNTMVFSLLAPWTTGHTSSCLISAGSCTPGPAPCPGIRPHMLRSSHGTLHCAHPSLPTRLVLQYLCQMQNQSPHYPLHPI